MKKSAPAPQASARQTEPPAHPAGRGFGLVLGGLVIAFALVRLGGMFNDLWLDELWSLKLVEAIKSPVEIFTKLQHDNNHPLNSLYLYLVGPAGAGWSYRLLSWLAGSATVWLAALIARRQFQQLHPEEAEGRANAAALFTAVLVGGSYLLIHYSSEARGYAPAVAFSLLAFHALLHASGPRWGGWAAVYGLACVLGLLSHLATVQVMLAGAVWTVGEVIRARAPTRAQLWRAACWQLPSWLFFAAYYAGFVRHMEIGGGPEHPLLGVLGEVAAYGLGFPVQAGVAMALPLFLGVALVALGLMWRRSVALVIFYALVIFATPALGLIFSHFTLLFPRYFVVSAAFALLPVGYAMARCWSLGRIWRGLCLAGLMLFLLGNGAHVTRLVQEGRGQYQAALRFLAARTPFRDVTVSSDHADRNLVVVDYYRQVAGADRKIWFYSADRLPPRGAQWLLLHRLDGEPPPGESAVDGRGNRYVLERVFRHAALSGWDWFVYRNEQLPPAR